MIGLVQAPAPGMPEGVRTAIDAASLREVLAAELTVAPDLGAATALAPEDLSLIAADITAKVACWDG